LQVSTPEGDTKDVSQRPLIERDVLEDKYQLLLENCSWGEQMDLLDQLQEVAAMDARQPGIIDPSFLTIFNAAADADGHLFSIGRALQVHEKLSSPSRRRLAEPCEAFQQHEAKQLRAQQHRAALQEEKSRKRRDLAKRMDEVRTARDVLVDQRKQLLERKMKQAEEKRMKHLAEIVKKAHDEEEKKKEIAFINVLEAQIKRHDFITHIQTQEERIQGLHVIHSVSHSRRIRQMDGIVELTRAWLGASVCFVFSSRKNASVARRSGSRPRRRPSRSGSGRWRPSGRPRWRSCRRSDASGKSASTASSRRRKRFHPLPS